MRQRGCLFPLEKSTCPSSPCSSADLSPGMPPKAVPNVLGRSGRRSCQRKGDKKPLLRLFFLFWLSKEKPRLLGCNLKLSLKNRHVQPSFQYFSISLWRKDSFRRRHSNEECLKLQHWRQKNNNKKNNNNGIVINEDGAFNLLLPMRMVNSPWTGLQSHVQERRKIAALYEKVR